MKWEIKPGMIKLKKGKLKLKLANIKWIEEWDVNLTPRFKKSMRKGLLEKAEDLWRETSENRVPNLPEVREEDRLRTSSQYDLTFKGGQDAVKNPFQSP